jgi:uncharacterized repeat protein (TIGR02543 family)
MPAGNIEITGSFSINSYTVTYLVDGEEYETITYTYGAEVTPLAEPTKTGYTFSGWSEIPGTMPANNVTVTGRFIANSYTITYFVDGVEYYKATYTFGAAVTPIAEPIKAGCTFSGWSEIPGTMPDHDVTVTGTFIQISINARDGSTTIIDYQNKLIYGLSTGLDFASFESMYVEVSGNAYLRYQTYNINFGTGTRVEIVNNETGTVIDTYYILIFGDLDGNGLINSLDASALVNAAAYNIDLGSNGCRV